MLRKTEQLSRQEMIPLIELFFDNVVAKLGSNHQLVPIINSIRDDLVTTQDKVLKKIYASATSIDLERTSTAKLILMIEAMHNGR